MKKIGIGMMWILGIVAPLALPIVVILRNSFRAYVPSCLQSMWMLVCACIVVALSVGHILMALFWHSLHERKQKQIGHARSAMKLSDKDVVGIRQFLLRTFGGELRLETDYRFPNGFRGDLVAVRGRGRYPIMCFEVIEGDAGEQKICDAIRELKYVTEPFVNLTQCFLLKKFNDGTFQLLKVRGQSKVVVGSFEIGLRDEIEDNADRAIMAAKKKRLIYPTLFLLYVVTPTMESMAILGYIGFPGAHAINAFLAIWIGAFLGVFGAGIKGYEPAVVDLMVD